MLSFAKAAIVGAAGPTGIHLARELLARRIAVRVISRNLANLTRVFPQPDIERGAADARDGAALAEALAGCDLVVDCIGLPAERMADHPRTAANVAAAARRTGARIVHVSSFWPYLPIRRLPVDETHPRSGGNGYIEARRAAEDILEAAGGAVVQLPDFFGPDVHTSTLQSALAEAAAGRTMNWLGPPSVAREYIFMPDAMRLVAELSSRDEAYGQRWIFPGAGPLAGNDVAARATAHLERTVKMRASGLAMVRLASLFVPALRQFLPMVPHYIQPMRYNSEKLARLLGPMQLTPYERAIPATLDWLKAK